MLDGVEGALQVCVYDRSEILLCHLHHQIIFCDSCIVHQNINVSKLREHIRDHLSAGLKIRHTALHGNGFSPHLLNLFCHFLRLFP